MILQLVAALRRLNRLLALVAGVALMATVGLILADIILRRLGVALGGSEEISGYVMAGTASWGLAYALTERAHVRIDILRIKLEPPGQVALDLLAIIALAATAALVAIQAWPVLDKSLQGGARANTSLETPLWIPQAIWFSGWVWFAFSSCVLVACAAVLVSQRGADAAEGFIGAKSELELEQ